MAFISDITITPDTVQGEVVPVELHNVDGYETARIAQPKTIVGAYVRVDKVEAPNMAGARATIFISARVPGTRELICNLPAARFEHDRSEDAPGILTQAYNHLKTLPEYAGAEDV